MSDKQQRPLRETDIRPDHLIAEQRQRYLADVARLLSRRDEFVVVNCPGCNSHHSTYKYEKDGLTYVDCDQCGMMFINPRPSPDVLEFFYANSENYAYWNAYIFPASEEARRERIFRPRAERAIEICQHYEIYPGVIVDVGAGFGTFCEEIKRSGKFERVLAIEPTPELAETCRRKGIEVIDQPIEKVDLPPGSINVITSFEVLEHLFSPRDFLNQSWKLLAPNGLLILTCPNGHGFDVQVLGTQSNTVDAEHLNYFHPAALRHLAESCGFDVLTITTPGKLDAELVRKKVLDGQYDISNQPFLQQVLIEEWDRVGNAFQNFLAEHLLSSHMWLVGRKKSPHAEIN
jgi:2-polyprenyl-3-methyl-5-hydroxy-6-metoxy-1,4-benzoquinol methylase